MAHLYVCIMPAACREDSIALSDLHTPELRLTARPTTLLGIVNGADLTGFGLYSYTHQARKAADTESVLRRRPDLHNTLAASASVSVHLACGMQLLYNLLHGLCKRGLSPPGRC